MFEFPSTTSLLCDIITIVVYVTFLELGRDISKVHPDLRSSSFDLVVFSGLRILVFIPLLWTYYRGKQFKYRMIIHLWLLALFIVILVRIGFLVSSHHSLLFDWIIIGLSLVSIFCQFISVNHLKSSVLPERHVVIALPHTYIKNETPSVPLLDRHSRLSIDSRRRRSVDIHVPSDSHRPNNGFISPYERFLSSEFIIDMKEQLEHAQLIWDEKVLKFRDLLHTMKAWGITPVIDGYDEWFELLLKLFIGEISGENSSIQIETMFTTYPEISEFFIPQLAVFLLYGSFDTSRVLQISILNICDQSIYFAHKIYWFINAFSLSEAGVTQEGVMVLKQLMELIAKHGEQPIIPAQIKNIQSQLNECEIGNLAPLFTGSKYGHLTLGLQSNIPSNSLNKASNSRNHVINIEETKDDHEDLMQPHSPLLIDTSNSYQNPTSTTLKVTDNGNMKANNTLTLNTNVGINQGSSSSGIKTENKTLLPTLYTEPNLPSTTLNAPFSTMKSTKGCFRTTVTFWERMTELSRVISPHPPSHRTAYLRKLLPDVIQDYFSTSTLSMTTAIAPVSVNSDVPSPSGERVVEVDKESESATSLTPLNMIPVYIPLANSKNKIVTIHVDECFAFSTKDRAPVFLCIEIIDCNMLNISNPSPRYQSPDFLSPQSTAYESPRGQFIFPFFSPLNIPFISELLGPSTTRTIDETSVPPQHPPLHPSQPFSSSSSLPNQNHYQNNYPSHTYGSDISVLSPPGTTESYVTTKRFSIIDDHPITTTTTNRGSQPVPIIPDFTNTTQDKLSKIDSNNIFNLQTISIAQTPEDTEYTIDYGQWGHTADANINRPLSRLIMSGSQDSLDSLASNKGSSSSNNNNNTNNPPPISTNYPNIMRLMSPNIRDSTASVMSPINENRPTTPLYDKNTTSTSSIHGGGNNNNKNYNTMTSDDPTKSSSSYFIDMPTTQGLKSDTIVTKGIHDETSKKSITTAITPKSTRSSSHHHRLSVAPPVVVFKESWKVKEAKYRQQSSMGTQPGWKLMAVIVKSGDDLRQEQCAAQLIQLMNHILQSHAVHEYWLRPYDILALSPDSGLIEAVPDTVSLDVLRKSDRKYTSLMNFFEKYFGERTSPAFIKAQDNFITSLASYCIICYIISLKDRHNGNILLDREGHIIHIDFGFILAKSPGGNIGFENAPFKLTAEFVELMGGVNSHHFRKFREICVKTFMTLRRHHNRIILLLEMLTKGNEHLDCFGGNSERVIEEMRQRFGPELHDHAAVELVHTLIDRSVDNWTTTCYDRYQRLFVGIF